MTSNTQGDTPPIQPDTLDELLRSMWPDSDPRDQYRYKKEKADILAWKEQALERERLEGQIGALESVICHKHGFGKDSCPSIKELLKVLRTDLSTLTSKDKDNKAQLHSSRKESENNG